jgi:hypothetical protein
MKTARTWGWRRKHRVAEFARWLPVPSFRRTDSVACIIATVALRNQAHVLAQEPKGIRPSNFYATCVLDRHRENPRALGDIPDFIEIPRSSVVRKGWRVFQREYTPGEG